MAQAILPWWRKLQPLVAQALLFTLNLEGPVRDGNKHARSCRGAARCAPACPAAKRSQVLIFLSFRALKETCHPDRSEPTPFLRVRFRANASARAVEGPWRNPLLAADQRHNRQS